MAMTHCMMTLVKSVQACCVITVHTCPACPATAESSNPADKTLWHSDLMPSMRPAAP